MDREVMTDGMGGPKGREKSRVTPGARAQEAGWMARWQDREESRLCLEGAFLSTCHPNTHNTPLSLSLPPSLSLSHTHTHFLLYKFQVHSILS